MRAQQPYNFKDARGLVQKASDLAEKAFSSRGKVAEKRLDHEYKLREMAVGSVLETSSKEKLIKAQGKQERKTKKSGEKQERKTYAKNMNVNVSAAQQMAGIAKPGTGVSMSAKGMNFTTPAATKTPRVTKSESAPKPKPKPQPSLARRAQIGKSMRKKGY
jgi:hypothetical protein